MTNLDALKGAVGYPMSDNTFELALINNGLEKNATYTALTQAFDYATMEALGYVLTQPEISEMGFSISLADKKQIRDRISIIREKYNLGRQTRPRVRFL